MAELEIILKISEEIPAGQAVADTFVLPSAAKKVILDSFQGNAAFTANSAAAVIWDYGGTNEKHMWVTKGSDKIDLKEEIRKKDRDDVKKIAVVCENGETGPILMAARLTFRLID